ncbi:MAG: methionyl-tRNA formyltransferase, partial [Acidobacteria bacterium]|nr:methionyl-tRNA formyltransferase [Acidobacteriota bacterium]MDW7985074.1 methionyl-tRNA formyltransferase [Acidobacteriota bacterium]
MTRILFWGTPHAAVRVLEALVRWPMGTVVGVVTAPDRPRGRGQQVEPSPVKVWAIQTQIPVFQPATLKRPEIARALQVWSADVFVVTAYGFILPPAVLQIPPYGCLNVHFSLLPKYRGAAPVAWALLAGERETGVTIIRMNERMDAGPILAQRIILIQPDDTAATLEDRLARAGAALLIEVLPDYLAGRLQPVEQDESAATFAPKIQKEAGRIRWDRPAEWIERQVRAMDPWPSAYTWWRGRLLKITRARVVPDMAAEAPGTTVYVDKKRWIVACGRDALELLEVQLESRPRMAVPAFL